MEGDNKSELESVGKSNISWSSFLRDIGYQPDFDYYEDGSGYQICVGVSGDIAY